MALQPPLALLHDHLAGLGYKIDFLRGTPPYTSETVEVVWCEGEEPDATVAQAIDDFEWPGVW